MKRYYYIISDGDHHKYRYIADNAMLALLMDAKARNWTRILKNAPNHCWHVFVDSTDERCQIIVDSVHPYKARLVP